MRRANRSVRRGSRAPVCASWLLLAALLVVGGGCASGGPWFPVPNPPELRVNHEAGGTGAPCEELGQNPKRSAIECWTDHISRRSATRFAAQKDRDLELACIPEWEVDERPELSTDPRPSDCPLNTDECVRPGVAFGQSLESQLPIVANLDTAYERAAGVASEYTDFQSLRRGHSRNRHSLKVAALALNQGILVLYRVQELLAIERGLRARECSTRHLSSYFDFARTVIEDLAVSDVPAILESYPPRQRVWERNLYTLQMHLLGRIGALDPQGPWRSICERVRAEGSELFELDADLNAWCGFAYAEVDEPDSAAEHWRAAQKSSNHPVAASYGSWALREMKQQ